MTDPTYRVSCYLQLEPDYYDSGGIRAVKVVRVSQRFPYQPIAGAVVCKVTLTVPQAAFAPLEAEGVIALDHTRRIPIASEGGA